MCMFPYVLTILETAVYLDFPNLQCVHDEAVAP
jgi:hypothetical protein